MNATALGPEELTKPGVEQNTSCGSVAVLRCNRSSECNGPLRLPAFTTAASVRVSVTCVLCLISVLCNLSVLRAATSSNKRRKSHVRLLIAHLSAADLLVSVVVMPLDAMWNVTVQWLAGDLACRALMFLKLMAMYSGAFVTVVISLDRQSAILNPLAINKARKRSKALLTVAWTMSAVLSVPQVFIFHIVTITCPGDFTQCTTRGSFPERWQETLYNMLTFCFLFLFPLGIMICCYTRILREISKRLTKDNTSSDEMCLRRSKNNIPKARIRTLKMTIVLVTSFIVCWTPYYLLGLWYWFSPANLEETVSPSLTHVLFTFGLLNACLDPVIYGLFTMPLRRRRDRSVTITLELENTTTGSLLRSAPLPLCSTSSGSWRGQTAMAAHPGHTERDKTPLRGQSSDLTEQDKTPSQSDTCNQGDTCNHGDTGNTCNHVTMMIPVAVV